jgi:hypothetical protein
MGTTFIKTKAKINLQIFNRLNSRFTKEALFLVHQVLLDAASAGKETIGHLIGTNCLVHHHLQD